MPPPGFSGEYTLFIATRMNSLYGEFDVILNITRDQYSTTADLTVTLKVDIEKPTKSKNETEVSNPTEEGGTTSVPEDEHEPTTMAPEEGQKPGGDNAVSITKKVMSSQFPLRHQNR